MYKKNQDTEDGGANNVPNIRQKAFIKVKEENVIEQDISPFKALDFIRDNAPIYAAAKANVVYMTEYRKTIKATLMFDCTETTMAAREAYAYAHPDYAKHLKALAEAVAEAEKLRWLMVGAEAKIEVWRSLESSARAEGKATS